jgi:hypothetical protein
MTIIYSPEAIAKAEALGAVTRRYLTDFASDRVPTTPKAANLYFHFLFRDCGLKDKATQKLWLETMAEVIRDWQEEQRRVLS